MKGIEQIMKKHGTPKKLSQKSVITNKFVKSDLDELEKLCGDSEIKVDENRDNKS